MRMCKMVYSMMRQNDNMMIRERVSCKVCSFSSPLSVNSSFLFFKNIVKFKKISNFLKINKFPPLETCYLQTLENTKANTLAG